MNAKSAVFSNLSIRLSRIKEEKNVPRVVVLIELTVLILMLASVHHFGLEDEQEDTTPTFGMPYYPCSGDFVIKVEKCDPGPVSVLLVNYHILDENEIPVEGGSGTLYDIYGLNMDFENVKITSMDNDRDCCISRGDKFLLKMSVDGGITERGYSLLLTYSVTGEKMNGGGTGV